MSTDTLEERGELRGHTNWVTSIACATEPYLDRVVTASRDKSLLVWKIESYVGDEGKTTVGGKMVKRLVGHNGFVEDVTISSDGQFALSGAWDCTLRLWDLNSGRTSRKFLGHTKDVMSVAFSVENRQIVSGSRDNTIKMWNTLGECKFTMGGPEEPKGHSDWVTCVKFSPDSPIFVSCGWDRKIKVWDVTKLEMKQELYEHKGYLNCISISPDGSLCASGGKDSTAMLWDLTEGKRLYSLDSGDIIHALCFSPDHYWLCAATQSCIKIWDLESKGIVAELIASTVEGKPIKKKGMPPYCVSLAWSGDGKYLFGGYTDSVVRVWEVIPGV